MPAPPGDRIRATLAPLETPEPTASVSSLVRPGRPYALGWATVELDRAARELAAALGLAPDAFAATADSVALGARCRVARGALPGGLALAILEPATEGRLAAMLARLGEGPAVIWFRSEGAAAAPDAAAVRGPVVTPGPVATLGPFGPERPAAGAPAEGPRWFLIGPGAGTIPT